MPQMSETSQVAAEIVTMLAKLPTPKHAAAAVAVVRANLFLLGGAQNAQDVADMIGEDDKAALEIWETINSALTSATRQTRVRSEEP